MSFVRFVFLAVCLLAPLLAGCGQSSQPKAPDKATVEQEVKQLNDIRQKESAK